VSSLVLLMYAVAALCRVTSNGLICCTVRPQVGAGTMHEQAVPEWLNDVDDGRQAGPTPRFSMQKRWLATFAVAAGPGC